MKYIPAFNGSNTSYCGCPGKQVLKNGKCVAATCTDKYDRIKGVDPVKAAKDIGQFKVMDGKNNAWVKICDNVSPLNICKHFKMESSSQSQYKIYNRGASFAPTQKDVESKIYE